jgi:hypothetical protein
MAARRCVEAGKLWLHNQDLEPLAVVDVIVRDLFNTPMTCMACTGCRVDLAQREHSRTQERELALIWRNATKVEFRPCDLVFS